MASELRKISNSKLIKKNGEKHCFILDLDDDGKSFSKYRRDGQGILL